MSEGLSRRTILHALESLAGELGRREVQAEMYVVGGSAMAIAYSARRSTRDVDAVFEPKSVVYAASKVVAEELGLPEDWLNDAVKAFVPGEDPEQRVVLSYPSLVVAVASPRFLLAMKLLAARPEQDADDIRILYARCGFDRAEQGMELLETLYPGRTLPPRARFLLEELFGRSRQES